MYQHFLVDSLIRLFQSNNDTISDIITHRNNNILSQNAISNISERLMNSNDSIKDTIINAFNSYNSSRSNRNTYQRNRERRNTETSNNFGRLYLNNRPYRIDNIYEYTIPLNTNSNNISTLLQAFYEPVEIFPTQSQIEIATRNVRYSDILRPLNSSCPISLERFNDTDQVTIIRHCGHIFNTNELYSWFQSNCRCPVCRYDIRNYRINGLTDFSNNLIREENSEIRNDENNMRNHENNTNYENNMNYENNRNDENNDISNNEVNIYNENLNSNLNYSIRNNNRRNNSLNNIATQLLSSLLNINSSNQSIIPEINTLMTPTDPSGNNLIINMLNEYME